MQMWLLDALVPASSSKALWCQLECSLEGDTPGADLCVHQDQGEWKYDFMI